MLNYNILVGESFKLIILRCLMFDSLINFMILMIVILQFDKAAHLQLYSPLLRDRQQRCRQVDPPQLICLLIRRYDYVVIYIA